MFAADPIRTALRDGWTDGRMDGCLSADCALPGFCNLLTKPIVRWELCKVPTLPFPSLSFPSLPFRRRSTTFIAPPSTIRRALNCRMERTRDFPNNPPQK